MTTTAQRVHVFEPGTSPATVRMLADIVCAKSPEFGKPLACGCTDGKNAKLLCPEHARTEPTQPDGTHLAPGSVQARINALETENALFRSVLSAARDVLWTHAELGARAGVSAADIGKLLNPPPPPKETAP